MSIVTRILASGSLIGMGILLAAAAGRAVEPAVETQGVPMGFGDGIRARNRLAPTPRFAALATGLYARKTVQAVSNGKDYVVQVWTLLVGPHTSTEAATFAGPGALMLQAGSVDLIAGDQKTRLNVGTATAIAEGVSLRFVNTDPERPAQLRAVIISADH